MNSTSLFQLSFFNQSQSALLSLIDEELANRKQKVLKNPLILFTPNPEQIVLSRVNPFFKELLLQADFLLPDGVGVVSASRLFSFAARLRRKEITPIIERIAGVEVVSSLLEKYPAESVLLIGGREYRSHKHAVKSGSSDVVSLQVRGRDVHWFTGYQSVGFATAQDEKKLRLTLRETQPTFVFVAFGAPEQEKWIIEHLTLLQQEGVRVVMAVGGSFDMLTGKLRRAPKFWQKVGLEWLYRLLQEPSRWKRQLRLLTFIRITFVEFCRILFS